MDLPELDERKAAILRAIVEEYVETAQPVGSQTVARSRDLGVSSATVRNDMTVLEREGFIAQPHTSAGRIPTDLGYRYFVDHFADQRPAARSAAPRRRRLLRVRRTARSRTCSTRRASSSRGSAGTPRWWSGRRPTPRTVRTRPARAAAPERSLLVVAVLSNGAVEREVLSSTSTSTTSRARRRGRALDAQLRGRAWGIAPRRP